MEKSNEKVFEDLQVDFYRYMVIFGGIAPKTSRDYVSRLKFLAAKYRLDGNMTEEYIDHIISMEEIDMVGRDRYASKKSLSDFKSGLRKFMAFVKSDYHKMYEDSIVSKIKTVESSTVLDKTEKTSIIQSRIGQGLFRKELVDYWGCCAVSGLDVQNLLIASHIKPWRDADNRERLDVFNGLLLAPNYDKLFDLGYITFSQSGKVACSKLLTSSDKRLLSLDGSTRLQRG